MKSFVIKCGYFFFSKECVNVIIKEVFVCKDFEDNKYFVVISFLFFVVSVELFIIILDSYFLNILFVKIFC